MNKNKILSLLCAGAIAVTCSCNDTVTTVDSISVLTPDGSRIISLNNSEVTDYVNNYYLGSSLNYLDKTKGDHYFPEPVEVKTEVISFRFPKRKIFRILELIRQLLPN